MAFPFENELIVISLPAALLVKRTSFFLAREGASGQMKTTMVAFATLFATISYAAPNKQEYELQERCGKVARESFEREWGKGGIVKQDGRTMVVGYQNHYNTRLNRCFYLQSTTMYPKKGDRDQSSTLLKLLFDINENKEYGQFMGSPSARVPNDCHVLDKRCDSEKAWDLLVKPYMED